MVLWELLAEAVVPVLTTAPRRANNRSCAASSLPLEHLLFAQQPGKLPIKNHISEVRKRGLRETE